MLSAEIESRFEGQSAAVFVLCEVDFEKLRKLFVDLTIHQ
jgi:hypothetical protein